MNSALIIILFDGEKHGKDSKSKETKYALKSHAFSMALISLDVSIHSRAARRATSPSLDLDKSLKNIRAPQEDVEKKPSQRPHSVLGAHGGGISKKRKVKQLSRAQKLRQRKGIERADNIAGSMERKMQQAVGRHKTVKSRRGEWDELNSKLETGDDVVKHQVESASGNPFEGLKRDEGREWMPLPEPGEELVLPLMMSRPPPRLANKVKQKEEPAKENTDLGEIT